AARSIFNSTTSIRCLMRCAESLPRPLVWYPRLQSPLRNLKECKRRICTGRSRETSRTPRVTLMSSLLATRKPAPWRKKGRKLERRLGREINYTVLAPKEFESRRARKDAFLENVWHNKRVSLVGA